MDMPSQHPRSRPAILQLVPFVLFTLLFFARSGNGMMDDPGLGWHLAIADRMWQLGSFLHTEPFTTPSLGKPFVAYSWLSDVFMWLCEKWGGLNAVGALCALTFALVLQILFHRITRAGVAWIVALAWTLLAAYAILPMVLAIPNMFTYLGIALSVAICERFHSGEADRKETLWLVPLFLLWTNMHSGFLSGVLVLVATYGLELLLSVFAAPPQREAARERLYWWTGLGVAIFLATLVNPNGWHLHEHLVRTASDTFIQRGTTAGWMPPDFLMVGWGWSEIAVLLFPLLLATSRFRPSPLSLALCLVFLHYALTGMRYTGLWIVIVIPTLANLARDTTFYAALENWLSSNTSPDFRAGFSIDGARAPWRSTVVFAAALLLVSRWLPPVAHIASPTAALEKVLEIAHGERVFHDANWGGFLTWEGRNQDPPFENWIDDRLDVHGPEQLAEYRSILNARYGWDDKLEAHGIRLVCLPNDTALIAVLRHDPRWTELYSDDDSSIYRRVDPKG